MIPRRNVKYLSTLYYASKPNPLITLSRFYYSEKSIAYEMSKDKN